MRRIGRILSEAIVRAAWGAALGALCCAGLAAQEVTLNLKDKGHGTYLLQGEFTVDASSRTAWDVLTDYDGISRFVSTVQFSKIQKRDGDEVLLEQVGSGHWLLFSREIRLLLQVRETPFTHIAFEDTSHQDFTSYIGSWTIEESSRIVHVKYTLDAAPDFTAPRRVMRKLLVQDIGNLLEKVRIEILRRSKV